VSYNVCKDSSGKPVKPLMGQGKCIWHFGISLWKEENVLFHWKTQYEGHWKDGKMDGYGVYTTLSGNQYKGQWKQDKRHGDGEFSLVDGTIYRGHWEADTLTCKHGFLSMNRYKGSIDLYPYASSYLIDQTNYKGEIVDGLMHGNGVITLDANRKISAHFIAGKPRNGTITLKNGEEVTIQTIDDKWEYGYKYKCSANIMLHDGALIYVECDLDNFRFQLPADVIVQMKKDEEPDKKNNLTGPLESSLPTQKAEELKDIFSTLAWFEYHFISTNRYLKHDIYVFGDDIKEIPEDEKSKYDL